MKSLVSLAAVVASLGMSSLAGASLVYGGGTETGSRFNPAQAGVITYMNCFAVAGAGDSQLLVDSISVGIRRGPTAGVLTSVGINIYAAEMTYDAATQTFGRGANFLVYSSKLGADASAAFVTQQVGTGALSGVTLNLERTSNAGLGGFWIGVEFFGPNATNAINGWRVTNAPTTGASINGFGMFNYNGSGAFESLYTLGTGAPSRFMVNVDGTLVPAPGALALLGLAGVAGGRRRR
jgi:MYXO-CTERM domain-containing protein